MSKHVRIIGILKPVPGRLEHLLERYRAVAEEVQSKEPDTLQYEISAWKDECFVIERYRTAEAMDEHLKQTYIQSFSAEVGDLLSEPPKVWVLKSAEGFCKI